MPYASGSTYKDISRFFESEEFACAGGRVFPLASAKDHTNDMPIYSETALDGGQDLWYSYFTSFWGSFCVYKKFLQSDREGGKNGGRTIVHTTVAGRQK